MAKRLSTVAAAASLSFLPSTPAGAVEIESDSRCLAYATCASCVGARYNYHSEYVVGEASSASERRRRAGGLRSIDDEHESPPSSSSSDVDAGESSTGWWPFGGGPPSCVWCPASFCAPSSSGCGDDGDGDENDGESGGDVGHIRYEFDCPLTPPADSGSDGDGGDGERNLLPDWIGTLFDLTDGSFDDMTLLDISLPGTHDTLSYDLSLTVSDDGLDDLNRIGALLHDLSGGTVSLLPGEAEEFLRLQAKTQQLTVTEQLDGGVRFLDLRIMMESEDQAWRSLHFMQSNRLAIQYFEEIRDWVVAHPREIIVLWLSRHGQTDAVGQDQYPGVSVEAKRELWSSFTAIFDGLLFNSGEARLSDTSLRTLVSHNHRVITFVSDYEEFTGSSPLAVDGQLIENDYEQGGGVFDAPMTLAVARKRFATFPYRNAEAKRKGRFTLLGLNTASPSWQVEAAAKRRFLPHLFSFDSCAKSHSKIPGMTFCPETLLDVAQLASYYNQIVLDEAYDRSVHGDGERRRAAAFPHALYLDALDADGTVRTGTQTLYGAKRAGPDSTHGDARYAYVDTVIAYNADLACEGASRTSRQARDSDGSSGDDREGTGSCELFLTAMEERRSKHPVQLWEQAKYGRHDDWPESSMLKRASTS